MTASYAEEWQARFGETAAPAEDLPDLPWLRQTLLRRTHRRYADRPVAEGLLRLLLGAAFSASSKSDFQQASVIRVRDRARRDGLAALVPDMPWIGNAPVFLVFCGDARRLERLGALHGHVAGNAGLEAFFNAAVDAALVMQTFILAAETAGLGCCPISVLRNQAAAVARILELPDRVFPVAGLSLGYPALEGHISMRLPLARPATPTAMTIRGLPPRSRITTGAAPPASRSRAPSSAPRRSSATPISTAGPRIRRGRPPPRPKARPSRLSTRQRLHLRLSPSQPSRPDPAGRPRFASRKAACPCPSVIRCWCRLWDKPPWIK